MNIIPSRTPPALAAFFTPELMVSPLDLWHEESDRWAMAMAMRAAGACAGLGRDPGCNV